MNLPESSAHVVILSAKRHLEENERSHRSQGEHKKGPGPHSKAQGFRIYCRKFYNSRTRDFYPDFADALSLLDEVILLDIYPAREEPIAGVTSQLIYDRLRPEMKKTMTEKAKLLDLVRERAADFDVLVVLGAGDADNLCPEITDILLAR